MEFSRDKVRKRRTSIASHANNFELKSRETGSQASYLNNNNNKKKMQAAVQTVI